MKIKSLEQGLANRKCSELPVINIVVNIFQLTKVLSAPDVHLGIILSQVVKPGLVNHKDSSSYDGRPGSKEMREATRELKKLEATPRGPRAPGHWPQNPLLAESLGLRTESALRLYIFRSPGDGYRFAAASQALTQGKKAPSAAHSSPDLMDLVGSVRAIFCSRGICSHLKCRLQSNPKGQRRVRTELRAEPLVAVAPSLCHPSESLVIRAQLTKALGNLCSHSFIQNEKGLCLYRVTIYWVRWRLQDQSMNR